MESFASAANRIGHGDGAVIESMAIDASDARAYEHFESQQSNSNGYCTRTAAFRMIGSATATTLAADADADTVTPSWQAAVSLSFALCAFGLCARVHAPRARSLLRILAPTLAPEAQLLHANRSAQSISGMDQIN